MAASLLRPCAWPGCPRLVTRSERMCAAHREANDKSRRDRERLRQTTATPEQKRIRGMYRTAMWRNLRAAWLTDHPYCEACKPLLTAATDVDHIKPHRGDWSLFLSRSNLQSLCHSCHSRKTAREDGGFGNAKS